MSKIGIIAILAVMSLTVTKSQAGFAPIIDFPGKASWRVGPDTPKAVNTSNGVKFPCAFNAKTSRVYWDYPVSTDLSKSLTVELELSCPDSEKVHSVGLVSLDSAAGQIRAAEVFLPGSERFHRRETFRME